MAKLTYDSEPCSRCGGSGHYSFNQITGTRCFKCGGAGIQLTKRGKATRDYLSAMASVRAEEVEVGDRVKHLDALAGRRSTFEVAAIERRSHAKRYLDDGTLEPMYGYDMTSANGNHYWFSEGDTVAKVPTAEQIAYATEYQNNLTKAGTPRKRRT